MLSFPYLLVRREGVSCPLQSYFVRLTSDMETSHTLAVCDISKI